MARANVILETFETACTWDKFENFHKAIMDVVKESIDKYCDGKGFVTCRCTHIYPGLEFYQYFLSNSSDGIAPYFTVIAVGRKGEEVLQWDKIKAAASTAILQYGGTITHHHAVGRDHAVYYRSQEGLKVVQLLQSVKEAVDPCWILNPGVLFSVKGPSKL